MSSSGRETDVSSPFGYLKASTNLSCVNLFVMPYNYPVLMPLLEELLKKHNKVKPPKEWRQAFDGYLNSMPAYYANPLKRALQVGCVLSPPFIRLLVGVSVCSFVHPSVRSPTHLFIGLSVCSLVHPSVHWSIYLFVRSSICSLVFVCSFVYPSGRSSFRPFVCPPVYSLIHSFIHPSVR